MVKCCICGCNLPDYGNNPDGACWLNEKGEIEEPIFDPEDRCCDECNSRYVIPGRIYKMNKEKRRG